jgi:hypothetical protein
VVALQRDGHAACFCDLGASVELDDLRCGGRDDGSGVSANDTEVFRANSHTHVNNAIPADKLLWVPQA